MSYLGKLRFAPFSRRNTAFIALGAGITMVGGVAIAQAAIPGPGGVISACYNTSGSVRIIDTAKTRCSRGETAITWNQRGPAGP